MKDINLHKTLKKLRRSKNISQKQLADILKIDQSAISKYENGVQLPELKIAIKISEYFETSLDYLIYADTLTMGEFHLSAELINDTSFEDLIGDHRFNFLNGVTKDELEKATELIKLIKNK